MMKKLLFGLLTAVLFTILLIFMLEISIRWFRPQVIPQGTSKVLYQDSVYAYSSGLAPLTEGVSNGAPVQVDRFGFRATSVVLDTSRKSWLLIGDSVTMGIGIAADSTFAGRLQHSQDSVQVINSALIGYDVYDYRNVARALIENRRFGFNLQQVTLFWCLNDIYRNVAALDLPGGTLRNRFSGALTWLRGNSRLYQYIKGALFNRPRAYFDFDRRFYEMSGQDLKSALEVLNEIAEMCRAHRLSFEVVMLPYAWQYTGGPEMFAPQQRLLYGLQARGIKARLFEIDKNQQDVQDLYLFGDGIHFSAAGHRMIAQELSGVGN